MIRAATVADVPQILAIYGPYIVNTTITFEYDVPSEAEFQSRFADITDRFPWLIWEEQGQILGYAYASPPYARAAYSWCAEPSVYVKPEAQGRKIGTALYRALEEILLLQGFQVLYALVTGENQASVSFHEKLGYRKAAHFPNCGFKFGRWLGLIWMEKRIKAVEIPIAMPIPWQMLRQDEQKIFDILDNLSLS